MKTTLEEVVNDRFGGIVRPGLHSEDGEACILEALSVARGVPWTDSPVTLRTWDLRPLNDVLGVPDAERTSAMLRLALLYDGAMDWPEKRQEMVAARIVIGTIREIISDLPNLPDAVRQQCRDSVTVADAQRAAAAATEAATEAAWLAADAVARAARLAARAAAAAADAAAAAAAAADAATEAAARAEGEGEARPTVWRRAIAVWEEAAAGL